jgi:hypothetical protein
MDGCKITTDLQGLPHCRLAKQFGEEADKAVGTNDPNTLHDNLPQLSDAMGITPKSGLLSFFHDGAQQNITISVWHDRRNKVDPSKGWLEIAESDALASKNCNPEAICTVKVAPNVPFFVKAGSSEIDNFWHNGKPHPMNDNEDKTNDA